MSEFSRELIDTYFNHGVDLINRRVFLNKEIDEDSIGSAVKGLYLMETESLEPVEMFLNSEGGDLNQALGLYDIMNTVKCPVHTFAWGVCMSATPMLLANGERDHRWVAPHVSFMHHDLSSEEEGTRAFVRGAVEQNQILYNNWIGTLVKNSNKTRKWWESKGRMSKDFYYSAEQAIEWGLADNIWVEK